VGFYSAFLVADKVIVTSKHNNDSQFIWESDSASFIVGRDPRGDTLGRGTTVSLHLKEEAQEFLEEAKLREIIQRYSQFITFNIYLWTHKTVTEEVPVESESVAEQAESASEKKQKSGQEEEEDGAVVEEAKTESAEPTKAKPKTKKVDKTVWDWELMNEAKPIWQRKQSEVEDSEYIDFYKTFTKEKSDPMTYTHFVAEGEVTFKAILFIPKTAQTDIFQNYNKKQENIKMYVRRVFISDNVDDLLPKYLSFVRGVVDSDDLPLNVSRETLQQSKLLKVIKKKLVRKILDLIKKLDAEEYEDFWKEYATNIKLGVMDDSTNRVRLAKLLRFQSSETASGKLTGLEAYVERMKEKQEFIYFIAGTDRAELEKSPFVERLLKKGFEVLYLTDPIDEYTIQAGPEFDGKRFQNVAKEGLNIDKSKEAEERLKDLEKTYEPLIKWITSSSVNSTIESAKISTRLVSTPMALVASRGGYSGNMERLQRAQAYQKSGGDISTNYFFGQKKILEINPGHPLVKELLKRVEADGSDPKAHDLLMVMFEAATLRSGYDIKDTAGFADRIEKMLRRAMNISPDEKIDEIFEYDEPASEQKAASAADEEDVKAESDDHEEL